MGVAQGFSSILQGIPRVGEGRRLLVVAPSIPHPIHGASAVLFYWYIAGLKAAGYRILNVLLLERDPDFAEISDYRKSLEEAGVFEIVSVVHARSIYTGVFSLQMQSDVLETLSSISAGFDPDLLLCLDLRCAWSAMTCKARAKIAWLGDLNFQTGWYHALYAVREGNRSMWTLPLALIRSQYWKRSYRTALARFSRVVVSSKSSEDALRKLGIDTCYLPYPWPAEPPHQRSLPKKPTLIFYGSFDALGSRSSFHVLINDVHSALVNLFGRQGFRIKVCGRGRLPSWAEEAFRQRSEFEILGFVPHLEPILAQCHALIAPIEVPVGNRSRILTALSQRLLVIAHANTALGNPDLKDAENCYLADTTEGLIDRIKKATADPMAAERIAERGFALYAEKFSPANAVKLLLNEISKFH